MILDSTFLVDLEREVHRGEEGGATRFLSKYSNLPLAITFTIAGELAAGSSLGADRKKWEAFIRPFQFLDYEHSVAWWYGGIYRELKDKGGMIGANDLWIAATAMAHDRPLVTRNHREFSRVSGLVVHSY